MIKKSLRFSVATLAFVVAVSVLATGLGDLGSSSQASTQTRPQTVLVEAVRAAPPSTPRRLHGVTRAAERAVLAFPLGGRLVDRPVELGQTVEAGQLIAHLDLRPYRNAVEAQAAAVAELNARLGQLERDHRRTTSLASQGVVSPRELELVEANREALNARLDAAQAQLREARRTGREARLRAPFDGVIVEVLVEPGEMVAPGTPIAALAGVGGVEVELEVPEPLTGSLRPDDPATVELPLARLGPLEGHIRSVGGASGRPGRLFPVVVALPTGDSGARPGMTATVTVQQPLEPALLVPTAAVVDPVGERPVVFVVDEDRARRVEVEVSGLLDGGVSVAGALEEGDLVVIGGQVGLIDGERVEVVR